MLFQKLFLRSKINLMPVVMLYQAPAPNSLDVLFRVPNIASQSQVGSYAENASDSCFVTHIVFIHFTANNSKRVSMTNNHGEVCAASQHFRVHTQGISNSLQLPKLAYAV